MRKCILEVKSWRTRVLIKNMFLYHFVDPGRWGNLWKRRDTRKKGYWFLSRGLRHFHTFALVVEENLCIICLLFYCFLVTKKELLLKALYTFLIYICCHCESYENKTIVNCKWTKIHKQMQIKTRLKSITKLNHAKHTV